MAKLIVAFSNFTNALKNSQDGAKFDCTKSESEMIRKKMNEAGARWRRTKNKHSSLRDALSLSPLSPSPSLSLFLTTVELRAARFSTRSSDYHYICFSTALSTRNMQTYVEILFFHHYFYIFYIIIKEFVHKIE